MIGQRPQAKTWIAGMLLVLALAGCGLLPDVKDETAGWSAEKLYSNAHDAMLEELYAGDQALRNARVALSLRSLCAAGDSRRRVFQLARE